MFPKVKSGSVALDCGADRTQSIKLRAASSSVNGDCHGFSTVDIGKECA
jgi:hypothetical protein